MKNKLLLLFVILLSVSCVRQRKLVYFQSKSEKTEYEYLLESRRTARIEPLDLLYIHIGSIDQPQYNFFTQEKQGFNGITEESMSVLGFTVNDSGNIILPVVGNVRLKGLTLEEAAKAIKDVVKDVVSNPIVSIRFVNNTITVLGEVARPGAYTYTKQQINLFNALGLAGDITEYGNKNKVVLIREKEKVIHKYYLDLTKDNIFKSEFYYLRPNDIIYVQPLRVRRFAARDPYALIISSVTAVLLLLTFFKK